MEGADGGTALLRGFQELQCREGFNRDDLCLLGIYLSVL